MVAQPVGQRLHTTGEAVESMLRIEPLDAHMRSSLDPPGADERQIGEVASRLADMLTLGCSKDREVPLRGRIEKPV